MLPTTLHSGQVKIGKVLANQLLGFFQRRFIGKAELDGTIQLRQAAITYALLAQQALDLAFVDLAARIKSLVHVHFHQEVHTTGQVQTEFHWATAQVAQPVRRGLRQVERHYELIAQSLTHQIFGWQLVFSVIQTQQAGAALISHADSFDADTSRFQCTTGAIQVGLLDAHGGAVATDLDRRIIRVQIGQGINSTDCQHSQNQQVLPEGKFVEHDAARYDAGRIKRPVEW